MSAITIDLNNKELICEALEFYKKNLEEDNDLKILLRDDQYSRFFSPIIWLEKEIMEVKVDKPNIIEGDLFHLLTEIIDSYKIALNNMLDKDLISLHKKEINATIGHLNKILEGNP
jgi:hypothetical protein